MIKTFSTHVLLSTATGVQLPGVTVDDVQAAIEYLSGESAAQHVLIEGPLGQSRQWARARETLIAQISAFANVNGDELRMRCRLVETSERAAVASEWVAAEIAELGASEFALRPRAALWADKTIADGGAS